MTDVSDLLYDAELIIEDEGKYYTTKMGNCVIDAYGIIVKVVLCKDERITKKDLFK